MRVVPTILCLLSVASSTLVGCKTTGTSLAPARATISPAWSELSIDNLAFLGAGGSGLQEIDRSTAEDLLEQELRSSQARFIILGRSQVRERARNAGLTEVLERAQEVWKGARKIDPLVARQLCEKLGVDGLLLADVSEWHKEKVEWDAEGASFSEVGYILSIVSGRDGDIVWQAEKKERAESATYVPGQSGTGVFEDASGAQRAERPGRLTPEPPPIDEVARRVIGAVFAAFPPKV